MAEKSWKTSKTIPRFLQTQIRRGLRLADSIGVQEADDGSLLVITFRKWKDQPMRRSKRPEPRS